MGVIKQGDIFLVPFPFSDLTRTKKRPVLILTNSEDSFTNEDYITAAITAQTSEEKYAVILSKNDLEVGHLKIDSISKKLLIRRFGTVQPSKMDEVRQKISAILSP